MKKITDLWPLMMPDGGGAAGGGEGGAGAEGAEGTEATVQDAEGQQPEAAEEQNAEKEAEQKPAKRQSFDELLKSDPEYAKEMQKRIDNAINRRFAKSKAAEEQNAKLMPALNLLSSKYGVEAGNVEALIAAINDDSDLIEQQAMDAGMEPEAFRKYQQVIAENQRLKAAEEERQRDEEMRRNVALWQKQATEAQSIFPGLNLQQEIQDAKFAKMLADGYDVLDAYMAVHQNEVLQGVIRNAAADAQRETIAKIQNKQNRPREGAAGKTQSATVKQDVTKFNTKQFDDYMYRAQRGEKIRF